MSKNNRRNCNFPTPRPAFRIPLQSINNHGLLANSKYFKSGDICYLIDDSGVIIPLLAGNFTSRQIKLQPLQKIRSLRTDSYIYNPGIGACLRMPLQMTGRVFNCLGEDLQQEIPEYQKVLNLNLYQAPPKALERKSIRKKFITGVNSIDAFLTIGQGQRVGLFAEAGTGKSTLLGMLARNSQADINVIALIGERGREVREFIEENLGRAGQKKSVIIFASSDETACARKTAALTAIAIAEYYRSKGKQVLLLMDSLSRLARAIREISLNEGELPVRQGYTPAVFTELPEILERTGNDSTGSITAFFTILTNAELENDPLADEIKSLLDGHIILSSKLAAAGIRPAIDIVSSVSRCMHKLHSQAYLYKVNQLRTLYARARKDQDLLLFGGTADKELQQAMLTEKEINKLITQHHSAGFQQYELSQIISRLSTEIIQRHP